LSVYIVELIHLKIIRGLELARKSASNSLKPDGKLVYRARRKVES
jgi:hypothetical protein